MLEFQKSIHHESEIKIECTSNGIIVIKKYRNDCACIQWLNEYLKQFYPSNNGLPVAQHEFAALQMLETYGFVPRPIQLRSESIVIEYAGCPISPKSKITLNQYKKQCNFIIETFKKLNLRHNDLHAGNVLVNMGRVKIIDFTLCEFGAIKIANCLPNNKWAKIGHDDRLINYFKPNLGNRIINLLFRRH